MNSFNIILLTILTVLLVILFAVIIRMLIAWLLKKDMRLSFCVFPALIGTIALYVGGYTLAKSAADDAAEEIGKVVVQSIVQVFHNIGFKEAKAEADQ